MIIYKLNQKLFFPTYRQKQLSNVGRNTLRDTRESSPHTFLLEGLPQTVNELPPSCSRGGAQAHAPKRPHKPTPEDKRLALRNALRYFPKELHQELAVEFLTELEEYGHVYMYRMRPKVDLKAWTINDLPAKTEVGRAIMHMVLNNLDPAVAQ